MVQRRLREGEQPLREAPLPDPGEWVNTLFLTFPSVGAGLAQINPVTGRFVRVSAGFCALTGYSADELRARSFLDLTHPEDCLRDATAYQALVERAEPCWTGETRYVRSDGRLVWALVHAIAVRDRSGETVAALSLCYDISRGKQAEAEQRAGRERSERELERLEQIFHTTPVGLCVLDLEGRYVRVNERLAEAHGVPWKAHLGATLWDVAPGLAPPREALLRRVIETGESVLEVEIRGQAPAHPGGPRTWQESWVPLRDRHGGIDGVIVFAEVVSERN
jgi:PAS domain S-box-containing protein